MEQGSRVLVSGSWGGETNEICLRAFEPSPHSGKQQARNKKASALSGVLAWSDFSGDVTDLRWLTSDILLACSSKGSVHMYQAVHDKNAASASGAMHQKQQHLELLPNKLNEISTDWAHAHKGPCTALDVQTMASTPLIVSGLDIDIASSFSRALISLSLRCSHIYFPSITLMPLQLAKTAA
jgi:hypothetical protein